LLTRKRLNKYCT